MRPTTELLRVAVGNPDLAVSSGITRDESGDFDIYDVRLPMPDFRGFPPSWTFAILNRSVRPNDFPAVNKVLEHAQKLIADTKDITYLVLISDDPTVDLANNFSRNSRNVFCIDHPNLPSQLERRKPQDAPFVIAVRKKLPADAPVLLYSPYVRKMPVFDWRFFGREKELNELVNSSDNIIIIGGRRIGKTSLMMEAERRLKRRGEEAYFISVQELTTKDQIDRAIIGKISPRDSGAAQKQHDLMHEKLITAALKRLARGKGRTTLLLDEISNVFQDKPSEEWNYFGAFRNYSQAGSLRFIFSCFSEAFYRQMVEFTGPFINFARTIRLGVLPEAEAREMVLSPLEFWRPLGTGERGRLMELITSKVGCHPLLLAYYCLSLFDYSFRSRRNRSLLNNAEWLLNNTAALVDCFSDPVEEIFYHLRWATMQYVFLRACYEAGDRLRQAVLDDDWLQATLADIGYAATTNDRRNLLDNLGMHGLCRAVEHNSRRQAIAVPIVYHVIQRTEDSIEKLLESYRKDIPKEAAVWGLERL